MQHSFALTVGWLMLSADKARLYMEPENLKKKLSLQTCQYIQYIKDKHINLHIIVYTPASTFNHQGVFNRNLID